MSTQTIVSMSVLLVSASLLTSLPAQASDTNFCNRVYQQVASAASSQSSKRQNFSGGFGYGPISIGGGSQYHRSSAASQADINTYYAMNCDNYIRAVYGVKLADILARERMNAHNNRTNLQIVQNTNGANVQMNQEDNKSRRLESKHSLIGNGLGALAQIVVASINRPRNPEPASVQPVASHSAPGTAIEPSMQPVAPSPYAPAPSQIAYAPLLPATSFVMFSSNPAIPVSPVIVAKVNAALSSQGLLPAACVANPIVVLNVADGQYIACAQPSSKFPPGNYRLNIPGL